MRTFIIITVVTIIIITAVTAVVVVAFRSPNVLNQSSVFMNNFFTKYTKDDYPVHNTLDYHWTQSFRDNWKAILGEYNGYTRPTPSYKSIDPLHSSCNTAGRWDVLLLRSYNQDTIVSKDFPLTMSFINQAPCTLAFFSILNPYSHLDYHIGVYKGVLRYHIALEVPQDFEKCFLDIQDAENKTSRLHWKEGQDMMFDDLFRHRVQNNTSQRRIILFMDIKRDFKNPVINGINNALLKIAKTNDMITGPIEKANTFHIKPKYANVS